MKIENIPPPRTVREWYAFHGGEEMGISFDEAAVVWEAATRAAEVRRVLPKCGCGKDGVAALCRECVDEWIEACE